jgi:hypothetical protein
MKKLASLAAAWLLLVAAVSMHAAYATGGPDVIKVSRHDISPPFSQLAVEHSTASNGTNQQMNTARAAGPTVTSAFSDPVAAPLGGALSGVSSQLNFDGQSAQDNRDLFGFAFVPPDTNVAVGAKRFVQMVNVTVAVYDKSDGSLQMGPVAIHSLWSGFGGFM